MRADCRAEDARREAEEGLALLPQAKISGKRDLKQFYTRLLNLPEDSPRPGRAGERARQALPAPKEKPAPPVAAEAKTPVASPEPAPPKPPPVIPLVPVTIEISESDFLNALEPRSFFSPDHYDLAVVSCRLELNYLKSQGMPSTWGNITRAWKKRCGKASIAAAFPSSGFRIAWPRSR